MVSFRPVTSFAWSKLSKPFPDLAVETRAIDGSTVWKGRPAVFLPGDLDRVTAHYKGSAVRNLASVRGEPLQQGASVARLYRNAIISSGMVMAQRGYSSLVPGKRQPVLGRLETIAEGALCSTSVTEHYFGHWLHDGLTHELWATDNGLLPLVLPSPEGRVHEAGYRSITGQSARVVTQARVRRLWMLEDHELTRSRVERLQRLRSLVPRPGTGPRKVFISRGVGGRGRGLVNERELTNELEGWTILNPEQSSPQQVVKTLADADVIAGVEGSSFAHAVFASKPGATWLAIMPPARFNMIFKAWADCLGMKFAFVVAEDVGNGDVVQPLERLNTLLTVLGKRGVLEQA